MRYISLVQILSVEILAVEADGAGPQPDVANIVVKRQHHHLQVATTELPLEKPPSNKLSPSRSGEFV